MRRYFIFGCFCFLAAITKIQAAGSQIIIQLPDKATVIGPEISLGEIADVLGDDKTKADRIRRSTVSQAAPAGEKIKITGAYIKIALQREGYSLDGFEFEGSNATEVLTKSQSLDPVDLLPKVKAFVLNQINESSDDVDIKVEGSPKKILLPAGEVAPKFRPSFSGKYEGVVLLTAELSVDGRLVRVLPLRLEVDIYHSVVTVTKAMGKGDKFTRANIGLLRTPSSKLTNGCFRQLDPVLGRTASMPLTPGTVIRVNDIYDPPVIQHGSIVEGIVDEGNIELTVDVRAIEDGKAGDTIRLENTETHKVLRGKVIDEKKVLIEPDKTK